MQRKTLLTFLLAMVFFNLSAQTNSLAPYCEPTYGMGASFDNYISNVTIGTLNNSSTKLNNMNNAFYNNLPALTLQKGVATLVSVSIMKTDAETNCVEVYIDLNGDNNFTKSEKVGGATYSDIFNAALPAISTHTFNITIPASATVSGNTRMRICHTDANPDMNMLPASTPHPCHNYNNPTTGDSGWEYGETEDYIVNVGGGFPNAVEDYTGGNISYSLYPNPTSGIINLQILENKGPVNVQVYNTIGNMVYETECPDKEINLSHLAAGVYYFKLDTKKQSAFIKKVVIQ